MQDNIYQLKFGSVESAEQFETNLTALKGKRHNLAGRHMKGCTSKRPLHLWPSVYSIKHTHIYIDCVRIFLHVRDRTILFISLCLPLSKYVVEISYIVTLCVCVCVCVCVCAGEGMKLPLDASSYKWTMKTFKELRNSQAFSPSKVFLYVIICAYD